MAKVVIDAGHGGRDPGAVYQGRQEKDDNLAIALAVGDILADNGVDVVFTRTDDIYQTPLEKAQISNREDPDFLISFHRNSSAGDNQYNGVETLLYDRNGQKVELAENINQRLEQEGFKNLGLEERTGLVILRRSEAPAVLVEVGFLNSDQDNDIFDNRFDAIAQAIADGVLDTINGKENRPGTENMPGGNGMSGDGENDMSAGNGENDFGMGDVEIDCPEQYFRVQTGAFRNQAYAQEMLYMLVQQGYPAFIIRDGDLYLVQVGAYRNLDNAIKMEAALRRSGYSTYLVYE